ncbi:Vacuolar protein sorting [Trichuris trichiura]|uniref:Vacuolar protein sorting n=1 Tax=Trichuris trichiura TaxID=36087 RepID=A0A077YXI0_TRITR|nr:Vacuolar protein sorting [Trichuris trichiura]
MLVDVLIMQNKAWSIMRVVCLHLPYVATEAIIAVDKTSKAVKPVGADVEPDIVTCEVERTKEVTNEILDFEKRVQSEGLDITNIVANIKNSNDTEKELVDDDLLETSAPQIE